MTDTGEMVKILRKRLGWSRSKLSDKAGMHINTVTNAERNSDCYLSTFERLIEAMGYEIEILPKEIQGDIYE